MDPPNRPQGHDAAPICECGHFAADHSEASCTHCGCGGYITTADRREQSLPPDGVAAWAFLSDDGVYRYSLTREVAPLTGEGTCTFVMLNPSTADAEQDDPTIRRCIRFARDWGFAWLKVVNLYAYRTTDPLRLADTDDPVGPENDCTIAKVVGGSDLVVCAWGVRAGHDRSAAVLALVGAPHCLGLTVDGYPRHPLYVRADTVPQPFGDLHPNAVWRVAA